MQHDVAAVGWTEERPSSCAENHSPMMLHVLVRDMAAAERVEVSGGDAGGTESAAAEDQLGRPQTRDREGQHWGLLSGNLGRESVCWPGDLAGECGLAGSAA